MRVRVSCIPATRERVAGAFSAYFFLLPRTATPWVVVPPVSSCALMHFSGSQGRAGCLLSKWSCIDLILGAATLQTWHLHSSRRIEHQ